MEMSSEIANRYFQGKENIAMALARRRIKSGGDVKAALSLIPITKPIYARYRDLKKRPRVSVRARSRWFDTRRIPRYYVRHRPGKSGSGGPQGRCKASPSDERRRPRQRAALPAGGGTTTAVPPLSSRVSWRPCRRSDAQRRRRLAGVAGHAAPLGQGGIVPIDNGRWTPAAVAHARMVARLRERGYSLGRLRGPRARAGSRSATSKTCSRRRAHPPLRRRRTRPASSPR